MSDVRTGSAGAAANASERVLQGDTCVGTPLAQETSTLLPALVEDIPAGILVAYGPPKYPIIAVNRMAEALLGCSRKELLDLPAGSHVTGYRFVPACGASSAERMRLPLYRAAHLGEVLRDEEWSIPRRDGSRAVVLVNANPFWASDDVVGAIACLRDVTQLKEMEKALKASERSLREASRRKDEFVAMLAHELRGPLAPIRTVAQILKAKASLVPEFANLGTILERQVEDVARLLEDVLDLSRVAVGKLRLDMSIVELGPIIEHALEWARPLIAARQHRLRVDAPAEPIRVKAEPCRLAQVFSNLLTNAAKYTEPGGDIDVSLQVPQRSSRARHMSRNVYGIEKGL
jgi:PAS domain S-box-containing protein